MACDLEALSAWLDGELTTDEQRTLEEHLATCPACRGELERLERTRTMLYTIAEQPTFHSQLMQRAAREHASTRRPVARLLGRRHALGAAAVLCLIAAAAAVVWLWQTMPAKDERAVARVAGTGSTEQPNAETTPSVAPDTPPEDLISPEEPTLEEVQPLRATDLPLVLTGTTTGPTPLAVISATDTNKEKTYTIGDEVLPGVEIVDIAKGEVTLDRGGVLETLGIGAPPGPPLPPIDGTWAMSGVVGNEREEMGLVEMTERAGMLHIAMADVIPEYAGEGTLRGNHATVKFEHLQDAAPSFTLEGDFNEERTRLSLEGPLPVLDGETVSTDAERTLKVEFTKVSEQEMNKQAVIQLCREEVAEMLAVLEQYREEHEGFYPETLSLLVPHYAPNLDMFADTLTRTVEYNGRLANPPEDLDWRRFKDFRPQLDFPDRLMAWERMLEQAWGGDFLKPRYVLRVVYSDPEVVFTGWRGGNIRRETPPAEPSQDPEARAARDEALRASCQNNMKQLGIIIKMFEHENEGYTPPGWLTVYPEYLSDPGILTCPADEPGTDSYEILFPATHVDYLMEVAEAVLGPADVPAAARLAESSLPLVIEKHEHSAGGRNVLFADGHVSFVKTSAWATEIQPYLEYR